MARIELANYLKDKRTAANLSQAEVSRRLGYDSPQFISNWERGIAKPPMEALAKLIDFYGLDPDDVLDRYLRLTEQKLKQALGTARKARAGMSGDRKRNFRITSRK